MLHLNSGYFIATENNYLTSKYAKVKLKRFHARERSVLRYRDRSTIIHS